MICVWPWSIEQQQDSTIAEEGELEYPVKDPRSQIDINKTHLTCTLECQERIGEDTSNIVQLFLQPNCF